MSFRRSLIGQFSGRSDIISFSGGLPHPSILPFKSITAELHDGTIVELHGDNLTAAQQYNTNLRGHPPLLHWAKAHVLEMHNPPVSGTHSVAITNGGNHTLEIITSILLNRGDSILVEEYTYPVILESIAEPKGLQVIGIPIDNAGIIPEKLKELLVNLSDCGAVIPKVLYTVPNGQNPTGATTPLERRRRIYSLCQQYNIRIIEDDPYFYLQHSDPPLGLHKLNKRSSYLSLDCDGRVLRIDSFAKFMAPGLRLGWVTAAEMVLERIVATLQAHTVGPCGVTQVLTAATLEAWGDEGLNAHLETIQAEYTRRAAVMQAAAERYLTGLAEWQPPSVGMFFWIKLLGIDDISEIWPILMDGGGVVVLPGKATHWKSRDVDFKSPYVRISFSQVSDENIVEGIRRLSTILLARK